MGNITKITKCVIISVRNMYVCVCIHTHTHTHTHRVGREGETEMYRDVPIYVLGLAYTYT